MNKHTSTADKTGGSMTTTAGVWTNSPHTPCNNFNINNCHTLESVSNTSLITNYFHSFNPTASSLSNNIDMSRSKIDQLVRMEID